MNSNNNYKILFISFYNDEAYGLRILHSILYHKGYDAKMLFFKLNSPRKPLTEIEQNLLYSAITNFSPHILAFSIVSPNFKLYQNLYKTIRQLGDFKIVVGGWQASLHPEETIEYCDLVCRGEGEDAILEAVVMLQNGKSLNGIKNIWYKTEKTVIQNEVRPISKNLSQYPICLIDNNCSASIEDNQIVYEDPYTINTRYGTIIGRGCPFKCTYCSNNYMANQIYPHEWSKIRYRTIDHVMEELSQARAKIPNLKCVNFYDEVFVPKAEWVKDFFDRYKKYINLPFYCMFFPGTCKEDLIKIMAPAGLAGVWIGVQSGSERVRKEVFKRFYSNKTVMDQANLFVNYGVSVKYDFIFDNPFETSEETKESIKLMSQLPKPKAFNFFSLKFFPQTEITDMSIAAGFITQKNLEDQLEIISPEYEISGERKQQILKMVENYG